MQPGQVRLPVTGVVYAPAVPSFAQLAARDAALVAATGGLLAWDTSLRGAAAEGALPWTVAILTGVGLPVCGFLAHEWGHLSGARLAGAIVHPAERITSTFLFRFNTGRSTPGQFLAMSYGGYAGSILGFAAIAWLVSWGSLSGLLALGLTAMGLTATFVIELPVTIGVARGGALPSGFVYVSDDGG